MTDREQWFWVVIEQDAAARLVALYSPAAGPG